MDGRSCTMIMTSVLGHVKELDFSPEYGNWSLTPPNSLFEAEVLSKVAEVNTQGITFTHSVTFFLGQKRNSSKFTDTRSVGANVNHLDRL